MIILGYLLTAIAGMLHIVLPMFYWILFARVIISWLSPDPRNPIVQFIYGCTEPMLVRVRDKIPPIGMLDLSPIILILIFYFLNAFLAASLCAYGNGFLIDAGQRPSGC